jgi:hypothetical protein
MSTFTTAATTSDLAWGWHAWLKVDLNSNMLIGKVVVTVKPGYGSAIDIIGKDTNGTIKCAWYN